MSNMIKNTKKILLVLFMLVLLVNIVSADENSFDNTSFSRSNSCDSIQSLTEDKEYAIKIMNELSICKSNSSEVSNDSDSEDNSQDLFDDLGRYTDNTFYRKNNKYEIPDKHEYSYFGFYKYIEKCFIL